MNILVYIDDSVRRWNVVFFDEKWMLSSHPPLLLYISNVAKLICIREEASSGPFH